jgi:hypothetical protein
METKTIVIIVTATVLLVGIGCAVYFSTRTQKKPIVPWTSQQLASAVQYFTQTANFPDSIVQCLANDSSTRYNYDDFVKDKNAILKTTTCMGTKGAWSQDLIDFIVLNTIGVPKACLTCTFNLIQQDFSPNEILVLDDDQMNQMMRPYIQKCKGKGCDR